MKIRTFGDKNFRHQKYILLKCIIFMVEIALDSRTCVCEGK